MVYYIGYYTSEENPQNRNSVPAGLTKMRYIAGAMENAGIQYEIVSCAVTKNQTSFPSYKENVSDSAFCKYFRTYGRKNIVTKLLDLIFIKIQLLFYLFKNVKKNDNVLVYHSVYYPDIISVVRFFKKCKVVLEVEEIYSNVTRRKNDRKREKFAFRHADSFVFPTKLLNDECNPDGKPYFLIHGTYKVEPPISCGFNDDKIHVVYAGTFDTRKGGAAAAVDSAIYLDDKYHLHILGFGTEEDTRMIKERINRVSETCKSVVTYDGCLTGMDYIKFIQSCHIGLSTQNPNASFNSTSYPSKILSYMANGLRVVTVRIPVVETSAVGEYMYYYDEQTPESIAEAIQKIDLNSSYNSREIINELGKGFEKNLKGMFN